MSALENSFAAWRKSSLCDGGGCVEVAAVVDVNANGKKKDVTFLMRNSKDPQGQVLRFTSEEWANFIVSTKEKFGLSY